MKKSSSLVGSFIRSHYSTTDLRPLARQSVSDSNLPHLLSSEYPLTSPVPSSSFPLTSATPPPPCSSWQSRSYERHCSNTGSFREKTADLVPVGSPYERHCSNTSKTSNYAVVTDANCNNNDDDGSDSDDDKNDFKYQEFIPLFINSLWVASARVG